MKTKAEIQTGLEAAFAAFADYLAAQDDALFEHSPNGKWSAGQHLDHLIRSVKPLNLAFSLPGIVLWYFGKANRPSRTYEELVARYLKKLEKGGRASGPFIPPAIPLAQKAIKLEAYRRQGKKLSRHLSSWSETALDIRLLPHPLLGKVTVREMFYFTVYHNQHHLGLLQERA